MVNIALSASPDGSTQQRLPEVQKLAKARPGARALTLGNTSGAGKHPSPTGRDPHWARRRKRTPDTVNSNAGIDAGDSIGWAGPHLVKTNASP